jgi:hypothetical protein
LSALPGHPAATVIFLKAGIDHHETIGEQPREVLRLTVGTGEADPCGLSDIVDANKNKIEAACPDAARLQIEAKPIAKILNDAFQIFRIGDWFGEAQLGSWHLRRNQ